MDSYLHVWRRCADVLLGVVLPIGMIGYLIHVDPDYIKWRPDDWLEFWFYLSRPSVFVFFAPLISLSLASLALLTLAPERWRTSIVIRMGVFTGALVSLPFGVALAWFWRATKWHSLPLVVFAVSVIAMAYVVPRGRWQAIPYAIFIVNTFAIDPQSAIKLEDLFGVNFIFLLATAPLLGAAPYIRQSWLFWRHHPLRWQFSLPGLMGLVTWLSAYAAAWRAAYMQALFEFSR